MDQLQTVVLSDQLGQSTVQSICSGRADTSTGRKGLGADIQMSPQSGATLYHEAADKHSDDTGTAMIAIAQTGPSVTLSKTHLTPQEIAK